MLSSYAPEDRTREKYFADKLHSLCCHLNHLSGECTWLEETRPIIPQTITHRLVDGVSRVHNWDGPTHLKFLAKSRQILEVLKKDGMNEETFLELHKISVT